MQEIKNIYIQKYTCSAIESKLFDFIQCNGKNEIWYTKNAQVPDLLYALSICAT